MSFGKAEQLLDLATFCAGRRTGITLEDVIERFDVSLRTAQRMLRALERQFPDVEAEFDDEGRKRWRLPPAILRDLLTLTAEELAALDVAVQQLEQAGHAAGAGHLRQMREKLLALVPRSKALRLETDHEVLLEAQGLAARPGPRPFSDPEVETAVGEAIKAMRLLDITYRSRSDAEPRRRRIAPLGILSGLRRYVVARDIEAADDRVRMFRLDAMSEATVTEEPFEPDPDFDLRAFASRSFGTFQSDAEYEEVVWRFDSYAAEHACGFRFHPDQVFEPQPDGSLIVRFTAAGHLEMCWHLYAWGDHVEVLAPKRLREMVRGWQRCDFEALP